MTHEAQEKCIRLLLLDDEALLRASLAHFLAAQLNIDESRAEEITAYLRPNPNIGTGLDQIVLFSTQPSSVSGLQVYRPLTKFSVLESQLLA